MAQDQPLLYYQQPYYEPMPPNTDGPQQYSSSLYITPMAQPIVVSAGVIPTQQFVTVHRSTNHCLCFLICLFTGGLSFPCWIYACITDGY